MTSQPLLQRLFESEFFDSWLAVSYLFKYPDAGFQSYLCQRLAEFPEPEVQYFIPQLCHLLVTKPLTSPSLESLLLTLSEKFPHCALNIQWHLRAHLNDMLENPDSIKYVNCLKVLSKCQRIFELRAGRDYPVLRAPEPSGSESDGDGESLESSSGEDARGQNGAGTERASLDGAGGSSEERITANPKWVMMGMGLLLAGIGMPLAAEAYRNAILTYSRSTIPENINSELKYICDSKVMPRDPPTKDELTGNEAFSFNRLLADHGIDPTTCDHASLSVKHYVRAQNRFFLALIDISHQLVKIPRENRQTVLAAELALLNNNLPARLCIPLWCSSSAKFTHDQIVRIPIKDAAVLNSKDKVPFVLQIEILRSVHFGKPEQIKRKPQIPPPLREFHPHSLPDASLSSLLMESRSNSLPSLVETNTGATINSIRHHNSINPRRDPLSSSSSPGIVPAATSPSSPSASPTPSAPSPESSQARPRLPPHLRPGHSYQYLPSPGFRNSPAWPETIPLHTPPPSNVAPVLEDSLRDSDNPNLKIASIMLAQLSEKESQMGESMDVAEIRKRIVEALTTLSSQKNELASQEDPSALLFQEDWDTKKERIRRDSPWGAKPNWDLISVIVKSGDDLRQEQLASQIIAEMKNVWDEDNIPIWIYPHRVIVTSNNSGLIETVPDSISIHSLKKRYFSQGFEHIVSLSEHFEQKFGPRDSQSFNKALMNFASSLAGYSLMTYILQLKDRHNGNILLDKHGHLVHVDFGFFLSNSPGSVEFEVAPFKLSQEYLDLLGGVESEAFMHFRDLMVRGFLNLRKYTENFELLLRIMFVESSLPCFSKGESAVDGFRQRFQTSLTDQQAEEHVETIIAQSCNNIYTKLYDQFQYYTNGILP